MKSQAKKQGFVWGGLLVVLGIMLLVETFADLSAWVWVAVLALAGLGVFALYRRDRSQKALLLPAYILWAIAALVALITLNVLRDEFVATFVLAAIALPFLVVFLRDRSQWWALIPTYILLAVGVMVALIETGVLSDALVPAYVLLAIALPFFVVYARDPKQWWALIPGGILAIVGVSFLIAEAAVQYIGAVVLVIAGAWILVRQFARKEPEEEELPAE
jgi:predicted membrane protein